MLPSLKKKKNQHHHHRPLADGMFNNTAESLRLQKMLHMKKNAKINKHSTHTHKTLA